MSAPSNGSFFYPNRMGRIILVSLRNHLGQQRLTEVLRAAGQEQLINTRVLPNSMDKEFPFETISALQAASEQVFGARAGRYINYRVGRGTFERGLKDFDPLLGISDLPMRLMPLGTKLRVGLEVFAQAFNQFTDQVVKLSETEKDHLWIIERCPLCWKRQTDEVCCQLANGLLDEAIFWGTGGHRFKVEEISCVATGKPTCTFRIQKQPLDS